MIISGSALYVVTAIKIEWTIHYGEIANLLSKNNTFSGDMRNSFPSSPWWVKNPMTMSGIALLST